MLIAREKRKENLAEYILYMWQVEDMLRAFRMDIEQVERHVVAAFQVEAPVRREAREWYDNLIEMMKRENIVAAGHLQVARNMVNELSELHLYLLDRDARYRRLHVEASGNLQEFRHKSGLSTAPDVEVALQALYGHLMLRLQKKEIHSQTRQAMETFSRMMAYLAARYRQMEEETGEETNN
ncbi:MAG: DUF4924 family protein [Odoribacteraceae bacterium]|jgi:hypothetical protein|nr:DUF4924 family protein [Odoribacteraceae bacterium]